MLPLGDGGAVTDRDCSLQRAQRQRLPRGRRDECVARLWAYCAVSSGCCDRRRARAQLGRQNSSSCLLDPVRYGEYVTAMDTLVASIGWIVSFVTGWFVGLTTEAFTAFVLGVGVGLILPWLWRDVIKPWISRTRWSKRPEGKIRKRSF